MLWPCCPAHLRHRLHANRSICIKPTICQSLVAQVRRKIYLNYSDVAENPVFTCGGQSLNSTTAPEMFISVLSGFISPLLQQRQELTATNSSRELVWKYQNSKTSAKQQWHLVVENTNRNNNNTVADVQQIVMSKKHKMIQHWLIPVIRCIQTQHYCLKMSSVPFSAYHPVL